VKLTSTSYAATNNSTTTAAGVKVGTSTSGIALGTASVSSTWPLQIQVSGGGKVKVGISGVLMTLVVGAALGGVL
jgi:hypothetical protein